LSPGAGSILEVSDNGVGLPEDALAPAPPRSGFRLIQGFADQLDGKLSVERGPGATIRIVMP
jgi:two-component sensor histidine kinase